MAILPLNLARVSNQLRANTTLTQLQSTQAQLLEVQNQLSTGRQLNVPSDNPGDAAVAAQINKTLEKRIAYANNLSTAQSTLSDADSTLGDMSDLLKQAQQLASANVGDDVTQDARNSAALVIDRLYDQMLDLGNKSFNGSYLFGGDKLDQQPFKEFAGGVQFVGGQQTLSTDVDETSTSNFQVNGADVFGALSTQIEGKSSLGPALSTATRLSDVSGATSQGVRKSIISINDGTTTAKVDLSTADTIGDVITAINNSGLASVSASINGAGDGITINCAGADTLSVNDLAGGTTAADLGIKSAAPQSAGTPVAGLNVKASVSPLTPLADLNGGAGIDTSGLTISNGAKTANIDLSSAVTVQDMLNLVNGSDTGVQMQIKPDGTGLKLINTTQGTDMHVSENGGTTASDLGLRSFITTTKLSELNAGRGVRTVDNEDFSIQDSAGVSFDVDLSASTDDVQDVIDSINSAATAAGAGVTASFATTGNGIVLTNSASGTNAFKLTPKNASNAAADLGLTAPASGSVISGADVNPVVAQGIFANINALRTALRSNDKVGITSSAESLQSDFDRVVNTRGSVGAQVQGLQSRQSELDEQNLSSKALLSQLQDVDFTKAATQFSLLQTSLQAAMQTTAALNNLSLMDFLK